MKLDFSIVIPTYNNVALLKRALSSCLVQKNVSFEVIISDDSTTDDIKQYVVSLNSEKIHYIRRHKHNGAVNNWNEGISFASGENLILLHHDEMFESEYHLKKCQELLMDHSIVISPVEVRFLDGTKKILKISDSLKYNLLHFFPCILFLVNVIGPVACVALKREIYEPFHEQLHWLVDVEWYYRMLKKSKSVMFNSTQIISLHGHAEQITKNIDVRNEYAVDLKNLRDIYSPNTNIGLNFLFYLLEVLIPFYRIRILFKKILWYSKK